MAYEAELILTGLCSIVAIYFLWKFKAKSSACSSKQKPAREHILEATTKRLKDSSAKDDLIQNDLCVEAKQIIELKEEGNINSELKEKQLKENMQSQINLINQKVAKEDLKVYHVKVCKGYELYEPLPKFNVMDSGIQHLATVQSSN